MGANNLYFPSVQDAYRFGNKGIFTIINDTKTGLPLKISVDKFFQQAQTLGYIDIPEVPTLISAFTNDVGYITSAPNFATNDLPFTGNRTHNLSGYDLELNNTKIYTKRFNGSNYEAQVRYINSLGNTIKTHFSNGELHYDAHLGSAGETVKHTSGRWDLPNTVTINKPAFDSTTLVNIKAQSASVLDTVFGLRNSTDTGWLFRQANNGNSYFYGEIYGETFRNLYFLTPRITIGSGLEYVSRGEFGFAHTAHTFDTDTTITTPGSYLMQWKSGGAERFRKYINGEFTHYHSTSGYSYEWWDYGNGFPAFTMEAPNGGSLQQRFRWNNINKANFAINSSGNQFNLNTQDNVKFEMRHIVDFVSNNVHVQKTVDGEWLFTNDPTSLQTPETGVRAKFYGTVKTVSPGASALDTAFAIRNNTDTSNMLIQNGAGKIGVNANPLPSARFYMVAGDGNTGMYVDASDEIAVYGASVGNRGVLGYSTNNYGGDFTSINSWALRLGGANGFQYQSEGSAGRHSIMIYENGTSNRVFNVTNDYRIISDLLQSSPSYADDTAASGGGVEIGQLYRNGSIVQIRIS